MGKYTQGFPTGTQQGQSRLFPIIKANVPGPFTFLLQASKELPKQHLPFANTRSRFRKTVGVRLPANPVASRLLEQLDNPLLCSSCHVAPDEELGVEVMTVDRLLEAYPNVDFVVDSGETWVTRGSTVIDLSSSSPNILRLGVGDPRVFADIFPAEALDQLEEIGKEISEEGVPL